MTEAETPLFQNPDSNGASTQAERALELEARLPMTGWQQEVSQGLQYGLEAAASKISICNKFGS